VNHKRGRPKNRRAGCLLCKPWKANGAKDREPQQEKRALGVAKRVMEKRREALKRLADG